MSESKLSNNAKVIITGAAGLVGQNLIIQLKEKGYKNLVAIDKHPHNTKLLKKLHQDIAIIEADLAEIDVLEKEFRDADIVITLHSQISATK